MKKIVFFICLMGIQAALLAQFSLKTEYQYIRHINQQNNAELIQDNIRNAEQAIRPYFFIDSAQNEFESPLLLQLTYSYYLTEDYARALWNLHLKLHLYPEQSISNFEQKLAEACVAKLQPFYNTASLFAGKNETTKNKQNYNAIKEALQWQVYDLYPELLKHALYIAQNTNEKMPLWLENWIFLNQIGLEAEYQLALINFSLESGSETDIFQTKASPEKKRMLKKAFQFYMESHQFAKAKFVIDILNTCPGKIAKTKKKWTKQYNRKTKNIVTQI